MEIIGLSAFCCLSSDFSCSQKSSEEAASSEVAESKENEKEGSAEGAKEDKPEILHFVDVFQNPYQVEINPNVEKHDYADESFVHNGDLLSYEDDHYTSRLGVDISEHQGYVDWQALKNAGFDFAFIRLGCRGYGQEADLP